VLGIRAAIVLRQVNSNSFTNVALLALSSEQNWLLLYEVSMSAYQFSLAGFLATLNAKIEVAPLVITFVVTLLWCDWLSAIIAHDVIPFALIACFCQSGFGRVPECHHVGLGAPQLRFLG